MLTLIPCQIKIGEIRLLRHLGLRQARIKKLPHSLGCLRNLQTLDIVSWQQGVKVSDFIWKLESLRHLYAHNIICNLPLKIEESRNLQTFSGIHLNDIVHNNMITLTSLRKLGILVDDRSGIDKRCTHLSGVGSLKTLHLYRTELNELPLLAGLSKLHHVTELKLSGKLKMLPPDFPPNLSRLSLRYTHLMNDQMPILEKLERLSFLKMKHAYDERRLVISRNGFHHLKFLELSHLYHLDTIMMEKAALPQL